MPIRNAGGGGGGAGSSTISRTKTNLANSVALTNTFGQIDSTQFTLTTTKANEVVVLYFVGSGDTSGSTANDIDIGYQIDSATAVVAHSCYVNLGVYSVVSFCVPIVVAVAGSYIIKLCARKRINSDTITIYNAAQGVGPAEFGAMQVS